MRVTLVGLGCGTAATMTAEGQEAVTEADYLLGAARVLDALPPGCTSRRRAATRPDELLTLLQESDAARPCVVFSGDTGFYSGARGLTARLKEAGYEPHVIPGISSVQILAARLQRPWQDWTLHSAHGTDCDPVSAVSQDKTAFFLTGGDLGPAELCHALTQAGLGELSVTVGENLSYETEVITSGCAAEFAQQRFAPLSVLLAEAATRPFPRRCAGFPDEVFLRGDVPMTKQEVRSAILAKLAVRPGDTVWDVGAGTGSVSVELAFAASAGAVFAVECQEEACRLIEENRLRFGAWNLSRVSGTAPEALDGLPAPDAVFIGGSKGNLAEIVNAALQKNPAARLCVSAIALETLSAAIAAFSARGIAPEVTQIGVSRGKKAGKLHLLLANNPVFLISGCGCGTWEGKA